MLSLSSQQSNASNERPSGAQATPPKKPDAPPAAVRPPPAEDVDLLGLDGEAVEPPCPSPQPPAANTQDLLGDLFGGPPVTQPTSAPASAQTTPRHTVLSPSPSASAQPAGSKPQLSSLPLYITHLSLLEVSLPLPFGFSCCSSEQCLPPCLSSSGQIGLDLFLIFTLSHNVMFLSYRGENLPT